MSPSLILETDQATNANGISQTPVKSINSLNTFFTNDVTEKALFLLQAGIQISALQPCEASIFGTCMVRRQHSAMLGFAMFMPEFTIHGYCTVWRRNSNFRSVLLLWQAAIVTALLLPHKNCRANRGSCYLTIRSIVKLAVFHQTCRLVLPFQSMWKTAVCDRKYSDLI